MKMKTKTKSKKENIKIDIIVRKQKRPHIQCTSFDRRERERKKIIATNKTLICKQMMEKRRHYSHVTFICIFLLKETKVLVKTFSGSVLINT